MKLPKETSRYCPYCKKHTQHLVATAKQKSRSASHPLSRGSSVRLALRGLKTGMGNQGRYSRKGPKDWKRKSKTTKRITITYKCKVCSKMHNIRKAIRSSRIEIGEKVSK
jgi:large subunit ribosomal protein L44e